MRERREEKQPLCLKWNANKRCSLMGVLVKERRKKILQMRGVRDGRNNGASNALGWVD
jgi:hypothetical protein